MPDTATSACKTAHILLSPAIAIASARASTRTFSTLISPCSSPQLPDSMMRSQHCPHLRADRASSKQCPCPFLFLRDPHIRVWHGQCWRVAGHMLPWTYRHRFVREARSENQAVPGDLGDEMNSNGNDMREWNVLVISFDTRVPSSTSFCWFNFDSKSLTNCWKTTTRHGFERGLSKHSNNLRVSWCHNLSLGMSAVLEFQRQCPTFVSRGL